MTMSVTQPSERATTMTTVTTAHIPSLTLNSLWAQRTTTTQSGKNAIVSSSPLSAFQPVSNEKRHKDFMIASLLHPHPSPRFPTSAATNPMCDLLRWDLYYKLLGYDSRGPDVRQTHFGNPRARFLPTIPPDSVRAPCYQRPLVSAASESFGKLLSPISVQHRLSPLAPACSTALATPMFRGHEEPRFPVLNGIHGNGMGMWNFSAHGILALASTGKRHCIYNLYDRKK